jgi:glycosyltransferase involved in cell wall biosynthesis/SAM-dependent methyltransferase
VLEKRRQLHLEEQFRFAGFQADVAPFYRMADAFVLPSVLEGFGLVKLEAMAHGLPLILTRIGDSDRLIENSDIGLIIPNTYEDLPSLDLTSVMTHLTDEFPANVVNLAAAMKEFVAHQEHWRMAGRHGREKVLRAFTKERALKSYESAFVREAWLARKQRSEEELRYENNHLRTQVELLERLVEEKTQIVQEKNSLLQEKTLVVQEKDRHLREQEQCLAELFQSTGQLQTQIAALQHLTTQQFLDLRRLSLTIFDRLDLTKRTRTLRTRLLRGGWNRLPQLLKKPVKSVLAPIYRRWAARKEELPSSRNTLSDQLEAILAQHQFAREIILFAPSVHWDLPLFQRPHQLALAFARLGCLVFFCEPSYSEDYAEGFHSISQGLYVTNAPIELFREIESPVVIVLSYNLFDLSGFRNARCVYDYIDELAVFPGDRQTLERNHQTLLGSATLVVATAKRLWHQVVTRRSDAVLCPNGVDYAFIRNTIEGVLQQPEDLAQLLRPSAPVIGYYGALAEWFDYDLVRHAAIQRPGYEFVLIGPDYDGSLPKSKVLTEKNIHWLGVRPYPQLPRYLKYFNVATIPFKLNDITHSTSPVKLFEYMAAQKPVVTTAMDESARVEGVLIAKDATDFVQQLDVALKLRTDATYLSLIDRLARENTWDVRAQQLLDALTEKRSSQPSQTMTDVRGTIVQNEMGSHATPQAEDLTPPTDIAFLPSKRELQYPRFLRMLGQHFEFQRVEDIQDATKRMWVEFALSSNERGRVVVHEIQRYTKVRGKKCLDIGCAYGGFLAAFAGGGAKRVVGVDINPILLQLAAANLEDCRVNATLVQKDLLSPDVLKIGQFNIITCNDVIEHVKDPVRALTHLSQLLESDGLLYMEIPNKYCVGFLKADGHYRLPGITLLPKQRAAQYHFLNFGDGYGVEFYRQLDYYLFHLKKLGLTPTVINPEIKSFDPWSLDKRFQEALRVLHSVSEKRISPTLAAEIQTKGKRLYEIFQRELQHYQAVHQHNARQAQAAARRLHLRYDVDFWRVIARNEKDAVSIPEKTEAG